ncbi:MAG TPA: Holliday junction DNA helicase RuvA, partial [Fuerstia sp.]|nr:Holliday junction DNA helicase RuvA [Fuerstiella sp.]
MITRITGKLVGLTDVCAFLQITGFEYEVLVPDLVRRQLQAQIGEEISLRTIEYMEGNPQKGRLTPRMIGF